MSSSSYYDAIKRDYHKEDDQKLLEEIKVVRKKKPDFGYRRVTKTLHAKGIKANHKKVLRLMDKNGLKCTAYEKKTQKYNSYKGTVGKVAPNRLNRRFDTDRPYQKIATDVTEVRYGHETLAERLYLTVYLDLFNREILTWNISDSPTVAFVTKPLDELLAKRPDLPYRMTIHSDQGFQYQNKQYIKRLKQHRVFQSMSRKSTCLDNACVESCFNQLKVKTTHNYHYDTAEELTEAVSAAIYDYNYCTIKEKLGYLTPVEYRKQAAKQVA